MGAHFSPKASGTHSSVWWDVRHGKFELVVNSKTGALQLLSRNKGKGRAALLVGSLHEDDLYP